MPGKDCYKKTMGIDDSTERRQYGQVAEVADAEINRGMVEDGDSQEYSSPVYADRYCRFDSCLGYKKRREVIAHSSK
jgi:hypothetical protein